MNRVAEMQACMKSFDQIYFIISLFFGSRINIQIKTEVDLVALNLAGIQGCLGQIGKSLLQAKQKIFSSLC